MKKGTIIKYVLITFVTVVIGILIGKNGVPVAGAVMAIPFAIAFLILFFNNLKVGIYFVLVMSFILPILGRYVPSGIPYGLGVDIMLVLSYFIIAFKHWKKTNFTLAANEVVLLMTVWMGYIFLQVGNPNAYSFEAWFYSMRGVALYQFLLIPLCFILFNTKKDWYRFWNVWLGFSVLGILWAIKQKAFGVDSFEQRWLDEGASVTHMLWGQLRIFSFYYDAGTFGAAMGQISIMTAIMLLGPANWKKKIF